MRTPPPLHRIDLIELREYEFLRTQPPRFVANGSSFVATFHGIILMMHIPLRICRIISNAIHDALLAEFNCLQDGSIIEAGVYVWKEDRVEELEKAPWCYDTWRQENLHKWVSENDRWVADLWIGFYPYAFCLHAV